MQATFAFSKNVDIKVVSNLMKFWEQQYEVHKTLGLCVGIEVTLKYNTIHFFAKKNPATIILRINY